MDEIQQPLTGQALLHKIEELRTPSMSRREIAQLCGYFEITESNQRKARLTDFYDAVMAANKEEMLQTSNPESSETTSERESLTPNNGLVKELRMSCGSIKSLNISTPPQKYPSSESDDAVKASCNQGFFWYPNCVGFETRGIIGGCWVKVYVSKRLKLESDTERAIVVPYHVSSENYFYLSDDNLGKPIKLESGQYQVLYQNRYLGNDEIESLGNTFDYFDPEDSIDLEGSRPELCLLTFIPTTEEIEPQILRHEPGFNPPSELIMFSEPMPQH